jgi:plasmid stabilization system protein ParE
MATEINWSERASQNLQHIYDYISSDSHFYAQRFVTKLVSSVEKQLSIQPLSGRNIPEFKDTHLDFLKEVIFKGYRVIYNPTNYLTKITIIAILNAKMDVPKQFKEPWNIE